MKPRIFIGSSVEAKTLCGELQVGLQHDAHASAWHQTFPLSQNTIDSLLKTFSEHDFAIFVMSADDRATIRKAEVEVARDNVLFEAGLFMGMHGKGRVFLVTPAGSPTFHLPTDLMGITTATYDPDEATRRPSAAMGAAVHRISQQMKQAVQEQDDIVVRAKVTLKVDATWPLKINLTVTNRLAIPVVVESDEFVFSPAARAALNEPVLPTLDHRPAFRIGKDDAGRDIYAASALIGPGSSINAWVAIDPNVGEDNLKGLLAAHQAGTWKYRCIWGHKNPIGRRYERVL